jgi:long-chain acyl-CoA synthetase
MSTNELVNSEGFRTLNQLFLGAVKKHSWPNAFLRKAQGRYQGFSSERALETTAALASALLRRGIRAGDRVAILAENRLEWALTDYAVMGLRATGIPIYPTLLEPDIGFILRDSETKAIVVSTPAQLAKVLSIRGRLPDLALVIIMDQVPANTKAVESWHQLVENELTQGTDIIGPFERSALAARPEDTATIVYTSGTTGQAKGVILTHWNISSNVQASLSVFPLTHRDVAISFLPLSHIFERMLDYCYLWRGVSIAYAESLDALPKNLLEVRPTVVAVVPRVLEKILEKVMEKVRQAPPARQRLFHWAIEAGKKYFPYSLTRRTPPPALRLKRALADVVVFKKIRAGVGGRLETIISGAAPLSREVAEFFYAVGLPVYEGYGLTETSPVIAVNYPGSVKLGTVGRVIPGVEVRFGDECTDSEDAAGREILLRGPNVTAGYYRLDSENREAFQDGWFCTGDLGGMDSDGFLSVTGRSKNLFKTSGGKYVAPEKIENLFQGHPYVAQIVVLGDARHFISALIVPDFARLERYARERGLAFRSRDELIANPEIRTFMQEQVDQATAHLPQYERIHQVGLLANEFTIASAELSPTQKIKRRVVEERYRNVIEEIYRRKAEKQRSGVTA